MSDRRWLVLVPLVGMALALPSLGLGLHAIDDPMQRRLILDRLHGKGGAEPWYELFSMVGTDEISATAEREGLLRPWYADDKLQVRFLRPVAAATHYLDHMLWPDAIWLMHLQSVLLYGLACLCVARLARAVASDRRVALIGAVIYALDEAHAETVAWLANRNGLIATAFVASALLMHHEGCCSAALRPRLLSPLLLLLALFSAEAAVGGMAFFFAYALFLDRRPLRARALALLPSAVVTLGWLGLHRTLGYGARRSGFYLDPLTDLPALRAVAPERALYLLRSQMAGLWTLAPEVPDAIIAPLRLAGEWILLPALVVWVLRTVDRNRELAFWLTGGMLAMLPLLSVPAHERLLVIAGIGWAMTLASLGVAVWERLRAVEGARRIVPGLVLGVLVLIHGVFAPLAFALEAGTFGSANADPSLAAEVLDARPGVADAHVVVLNAPNQLHGALVPFERVRRGLPVQRSHSVLGATLHRFEVTRIDERTLDLACPLGYLEDVFSRFYRSPSYPLPLGQPIRVRDFTAEVRWSILDGRPQRIRFHFDRPLDDPALRFIFWNGRAYQDFEFAPIGVHKSIPAVYDSRPVTTFP